MNVLDAAELTLKWLILCYVICTLWKGNAAAIPVNSECLPAIKPLATVATQRAPPQPQWRALRGIQDGEKNVTFVLWILALDS